MSTAPTLPQFVGGTVTDTQLNGLAAGITYATGLGQKLSNLTVVAALTTPSLAGSVSATYVDVTGVSTSWTKLGDASSSNILVIEAVSCYVSVASTAPMFGLGLGGTDYDVAFMILNAINTHTTIFGARLITGVGAGAYTPKMRFKRVGGTGTTTVDTGDSAFIIIGELPL